MEMTEKKRLLLASAKWRLYTAEADQATKMTIVNALQNNGLAVQEVVQYWKEKDRPMLSISFEGALFVRDSFPNPKWKRVLLYSIGNGLTHWRGESPFLNPLVTSFDNNKLFTPKRASRQRSTHISVS